MDRILPILIVTTVALMACQVADKTPVPTRPAETIEATILSSGVQRTYLLHLPPGVDQTPRPLVVNIHGLGGSARQQESLSEMSALADREGFIVVYPEGLGPSQQGWQIAPASDDLLFLRNLVSELQSTYAIDTRRIYATGQSNGGGMANRLACDAADLFAAVAPVSGAYTFHEQCRPARPIPIMIIHGRDDPVVPYHGSFQTPDIRQWAGLWAKRNGCGPEPERSSPEPGVDQETWLDCRQAATVLYSITGSGHSWPGSARARDTFAATEAIWAFFADHPLPPD